MREVMEVLLRAAKTPASILILGESGTGKSVAARAVHEKSHLADKPFVTVSCPSLSKELLESELFGHVQRLIHRRDQGSLGQGQGRRRRNAFSR